MRGWLWIQGGAGYSSAKITMTKDPKTPEGLIAVHFDWVAWTGCHEALAAAGCTTSSGSKRRVFSHLQLWPPSRSEAVAQDDCLACALAHVNSTTVSKACYAKEKPNPAWEPQPDRFAAVAAGACITHAWPARASLLAVMEPKVIREPHGAN